MRARSSNSYGQAVLAPEGWELEKPVRQHFCPLRRQNSVLKMFLERLNGQDSSGTAPESFLFQLDVADAAFDSKAQGVGRLSVCSVDVLTAFIFLEAVDIDGAQTTMNGRHDSDVFRQVHNRFTDAALNDGLQILASLAGQIDVGLACADVELQARQVDFGEVQIAASGAHVNLEFERNFIVHFQVPHIV